MAMRVAGHNVPRDRVVELLRQYANECWATVLYYDLAGDDDRRSSEAGAAAAHLDDRVTLADIGRLQIFNARISANDVWRLMASDLIALADVPPNTRLEDATRGSSSRAVMRELYSALRLPNIGHAKRSKLLHLKRPSFVPITDGMIRGLYAPVLQVGDGGAGDDIERYWEAIRQDLIAGRAVLREAARQLDETEQERRLSRLTPLRLLDIVAWQIAGGRCGRSETSPVGGVE